MPFSAIFHAARRPADNRRRLLVALLIVAMLCSHWQGLVHRISHASRMLGGIETAQMLTVDGAAAASVVSTDQSPDQNGAGHSCLAFDAATVGAALCGTPFTALLSAERPVLQAWIAFISYLAPLTPHFSSRAPPLP
jgi:hypothetical protein